MSSRRSGRSGSPSNGREFDVMICFPKLVSTGLDLFSKVQGGHNYNCIVFYETGYKLNDMRQAARRAWRIGQPRDCYIYYLYYQGTMQHRAMSLMSKKMAAALALEGEFSEEGLAAMSGEGDEQMALAKSMSEKIDDADMQRSWTKVKSMAEKKKPAKKKPVEATGGHGRRVKPSPLDNLLPEAATDGSYDPGAPGQASARVREGWHRGTRGTVRCGRRGNAGICDPPASGTCISKVEFPKPVKVGPGETIKITWTQTDESRPQWRSRTTTRTSPSKR